MSEGRTGVAQPSTQEAVTFSSALREQLDEEGFLQIPGALSPAMVDRLLQVHDRVYEEERAAGSLAPNGSLHLFAFVLRDDLYLELLDCPATLPLVCGALGWNIYMYHCHLDVHPPVTGPEPLKWGWHQDGGRQNLEIETEPVRPRLSLKIAYFLSDVSEPGRGNLMVIPGSHHRNRIRRPEHPELGFEEPSGAVPILADPGTAVLFDRRLWHSRSSNRSMITRKAVFLGYTYRWVRPRDDYAMDRSWLAGLSPVRQQLLGGGLDALSFWGLGEDLLPLKGWMEERGLVDPLRPAHR
ncbi:MAG: phytanoyl-CoA dioxygenase family protein [Actinobacteria bacterium]|nr:MAG: phytanoyl-CoA dioxygenase family protein [Actinomycetota bacterium]